MPDLLCDCESGRGGGGRDRPGKRVAGRNRRAFSEGDRGRGRRRVAEESASAVWLQAVSSEPSLRGTVVAAVITARTDGPHGGSGAAPAPSRSGALCDLHAPLTLPATRFSRSGIKGANTTS